MAIATRPAPYDEAHTTDGEPRAHYAGVLDAIDSHGAAEASAAVRGHVDARGCAFGSGSDREPFAIDPVPRVITADEWAALAAGLEQRTRALDRFLRDIYGPQRSIAEGVIPGYVIGTASGDEPEAAALPAQQVRVLVAGIDVVRAPSGEFLVLEDNVRTPSGLAYMFAARRALAALGIVSDAVADVEGPTVAALCRALDTVAPGSRHVVLTDGPANPAYWEHRWLAGALGAELAEGDVADAGLVYRRTNDERLDGASAALRAAVADGRTVCLNAFGNGVADDKLTQAYVEDLIRFHLGEEPLLRSVPTYDMGDPVRREQALDRLDEMVVKPRGEQGGEGVYIGPRVSARERDEAAAAVRDDPEGWIAQDTVLLSEHPTVIEGHLVPRHVDLRAFVVYDGERAFAAPGGLTRVALDAGELIVNSSLGGGGKDTWVLR